MVGEVEQGLNQAKRSLETNMDFLTQFKPDETRVFNAREFARDTNAMGVDVINQATKIVLSIIKGK